MTNSTVLVRCTISGRFISNEVFKPNPPWKTDQPLSSQLPSPIWGPNPPSHTYGSILRFPLFLGVHRQSTSCEPSWAGWQVHSWGWALLVVESVRVSRLDFLIVSMVVFIPRKGDWVEQNEGERMSPREKYIHITHREERKVSIIRGRTEHESHGFLHHPSPVVNFQSAVPVVGSF